MKRTAALILLLACFIRASAAPYGAGFYDTSEYLMGKVAVAIVFPQSNGSLQAKTEINNWTEAKKAAVVGGVQEAMGWWAERNSAANLSFVYVTTTVPTGYEPINCNAMGTSSPATPPCNNGEEDWIKDVMGRMGYSENDYGARVYHYNNDVRAANHTDWAFTIFVVDSDKDLDGEFPDNYFAYAYLGGPFAVTTYDNDSYGIGYYAPVIAHEMGHIFYAQDEYAASGCTPASYTGYLNIANSNCENGGSSNAGCIMRGDIGPYYTPAVCDYTRNMLGWRDGNSNGVPDIADLPPTTALSPFAPDPTTNATPAYYGMAHSTSAYANDNPYTDDTSHYYYTSARNNISVNRIASVEYKVDGGAWLAAAARDGAFDQTIESFTFTTAALADGVHTIQARARDNFGAYDAAPGSDSLTVNTVQPSDIAYVNDGTDADIDYVPSKTALSANWGGSSHPSGIDRYEYAIGAAPGGTDVAGWTSVGAARSVTRSGLSLAENALYYFSVRAHSANGFYSGATASDGQRVDTTSPTARVLITSPLPARGGAFSARLIVTEANGLAGDPTLKMAPGCGAGPPMDLAYEVFSTWTASAFIESYFSTGTACFTFAAADLAGNTGSVITSGGSFTIDPAVSGASGGMVANSDGAAVVIPAGAYSGGLYVTISTVPSSRTAAADGISYDSLKIRSTDLVREFTAHNSAGAPVTVFSSPLTITLPYPDANNDGRIDGDFVKESLAWLYYLDEGSGKWTPLSPVARNLSSNTVSAPVSHFSVYSVRASNTSDAGLSGLKAYPNPCDFRKSPAFTIAGAPADAANARVYIYNEAGELVRTLVPGSGIDNLNVAAWDGRLESGSKAASGLYIYLFKTDNYGKSKGKFFTLW